LTEQLRGYAGDVAKGRTRVVASQLRRGGRFDRGARHRVTTMFGVPTMFEMMAQHPNFKNADLSSLRINF